MVLGIEPMNIRTRVSSHNHYTMASAQANSMLRREKVLKVFVTCKSFFVF